MVVKCPVGICPTISWGSVRFAPLYTSYVLTLYPASRKAIFRNEPTRPTSRRSRSIFFMGGGEAEGQGLVWTLDLFSIYKKNLPNIRELV